MQSLKNKMSAWVIVAALAPLAAMAHQGETHTTAAFGSAAPALAATRIVVISATTKAVNVDKGDVVTFKLDGKAFTWQFDTLRDSDSFLLSAVAPEGMDVRSVRVYVAPNPLYRN